MEVLKKSKEDLEVQVIKNLLLALERIAESGSAEDIISLSKHILKIINKSDKQFF